MIAADRGDRAAPRIGRSTGVVRLRRCERALGTSSSVAEKCQRESSKHQRAQIHGVLGTGDVHSSAVFTSSAARTHFVCDSFIDRLQRARYSGPIARRMTSLRLESPCGNCNRTICSRTRSQVGESSVDSWLSHAKGVSASAINRSSRLRAVTVGLHHKVAPSAMPHNAAGGWPNWPNAVVYRWQRVRPIHLR